MDLGIDLSAISVKATIGAAVPASVTLSAIGSAGTGQDASLQLSVDLDLAVKPRLQIGGKPIALASSFTFSVPTVNIYKQNFGKGNVTKSPVPDISGILGRAPSCYSGKVSLYFINSAPLQRQADPLVKVEYVL